MVVLGPRRPGKGLHSAIRCHRYADATSRRPRRDRARALAAGTADHVDDGGSWQAQTGAGIRAFRHAAAALGGRTATDLYAPTPDAA